MPQLPQQSLSTYTFGAFAIDEASLTFRHSGEVVPLPIKPWNALLLLVQSAPDTVSKNELIESVWPGRVVTDGVLSQVISRLRAVLGDDKQEIIKSLYGVGFRLTLPVVRKQNPSRATENSTILLPGSSVRERANWVLERVLSTSKRNSVWLARHNNGMGQRVFKFASDGSGLRALKREFSVTRVLQAAQTTGGIVEVLEADFTAEPFFIALPYLPCGNLVDFLEANPNLGKSRKIDLLILIAETIAQCHAAGIIHGDIKPKNILVDSDSGVFSTRLADFGSAVVVDETRLRALELSAVNQTESLISDPGGGTLAYAAPERLTGKPASTAGDAYAFGVTAFQLFCNEFSRPLTPGWEELIDDALLETDIRELCHVNPLRRPSFSEIAARLATLDARSEAKILREREAAEFEAVKADAVKREHERALDLARIDYLTRRRRLLGWVAACLAGLLALTLSGFYSATQQRQIASKSSYRATAVRESLMQALVDAANPFQGGDPGVKVVDVLEPLAGKLSTEMPDESDYVARIKHSFGIVLLLAKKYDAAERIYRDAIKHGSSLSGTELAECQMGLADTLRQQGKHAESIGYYSYAAKNSSDAVVMYRSELGFAIASVRVGNAAAAMAAVQSARRIKLPKAFVPPASLTYGTLATEADALTQLGDFDTAKHVYLDIIKTTLDQPKLSPFTPLGYRGLAKIEAANGKFNEAISLQQKAISALNPAFPIGSPAQYDIQLAALLVYANRYDEAKHLILRYVNLDAHQSLAIDDHALAQELLGRIALSRGEHQLAADFFGQARKATALALGERSTAFRRVTELERLAMSQRDKHL